MTEHVLLEELVARLARREPVVLNTGRALPWVIENVLTPLRYVALRSGYDPDALLKDTFCIIGEKGGSRASYNNDGVLQLRVDPSLRLPLVVRLWVSRLVEQEFADSLIYDVSKDGMITVEKADAVSLAHFPAIQDQFVSALTSFLHSRGLDGLIRIDRTSIAVDLQHPRAGKALGAARALQWANRHGHVITEARCFGDSLSDIEMADECHRRGIRTTFHFVGARNLANPDELSPRPYPIETTPAPFGQGTASVLAHDRIERGITLSAPLSLGKSGNDSLV
ncbi:MAG: hypothetical protein ACP5OR_02975 [Candidatus Dormibacteria bacterium]